MIRQWRRTDPRKAFPFGAVVTVATMVVVATTAVTGCAPKEPSKPRMFVSSQEFNSGRKAGRRDAKASWTEESAAWTWLWMMDEQYRHGYEEGWREGREEVKFEAEQEKARALKDQQKQADKSEE